MVIAAPSTIDGARRNPGHNIELLNQFGCSPHAATELSQDVTPTLILGCQDHSTQRFVIVINALNLVQTGKLDHPRRKEPAKATVTDKT